MSTPQLVGKYNDPIFHQIKASFNERSDDYPVLMLPVRLETKFMEFARVIKPIEPKKGNVNKITQDIYNLIFKIKVWVPEAEKLDGLGLTAKFLMFSKDLKKIQERVNELLEISRVERLILREGASDLLSTVNSIVLEKENASTKNSLVSEIGAFQKAIEKIKSPSRTVYDLGKKYLSSLVELNKSIDKIFVTNKMNASLLDAELDGIQKLMFDIDKMADSPDFRVTESMTQEISSKISYIKRQHKSGNVRLTDFKVGYTGERDLKVEEYELRKKINALQVTIEKEHLPVARVKEALKTYPIKQLTADILKVSSFVRPIIKLGFNDFSQIAKFLKQLFSELDKIQKNALIPLEGNLNEAELLKKTYSRFKLELLSFQKSLVRIRIKDRRESANIEGTSKQLLAFFDGMIELEKGVKPVESQLISDAKIRKSTLSMMETRKLLLDSRKNLKSSTSNHQETLKNLKKELKRVQKETKVSTSTTSILPESEFKELKNTFFGLRDQVHEIIKANPLPEAMETKKETDGLLTAIENQVLDQLTDVNNPKDRFFKDYKDRVTFVIPSETVRELWVRIFPDDIAIDNHDERLTDDEEKIAREFYYEVYSKEIAKRQEAKLGAWRAAASSLGVRRAAYAIKAVEPSEVKSGAVDEIKNRLGVFLSDVFGEKRNRLSKNIDKSIDIIKLQNSFDKAGLNIRKMLSPQAFSPCLENKKTLDNAISYFKELIDLLKIEVGSLKIREKNKEAELLAISINQAGKIVYEYYKANALALSQSFRPELTFPTVEKKTQSWDRAGITEMLPDRFVVVTKRDSFYQHIVTGKTIQKPLPVSIDPTGDQADRFNNLDNGDLEIPEEINWMFDFDAAVDAGMAVKIPLDKEDYNAKYDLVMVYGVQDRDAQESQLAIDKLFTNHLFSEGGLEYLPLGTATNNTEDVKSPYRALDNDLDGAFELFFVEEKPAYLNSSDDANELKISDGQFFKEALGLPTQISDFIRHHDKKEIVEGRAMNRALYNATLKYFFKVMVGDLFTDNDISHTLLFFLHHVSGIGTLPVFRVDNQPYGVLPVSPVRLFKAQGDAKKGTESSYIRNLTLFLKQTKAAFDHFEEQPLHVNSEAYEASPQKEFLKVLGLEPNSKEFFYRFGVNAANRWQEPTNDDAFDFEVNWDHIQAIYTPEEVAKNFDLLLKELGHTSPATQKNAVDKSNIYKNRFTEGNFILGDLVQDERLDGTSLAQTDKDKNYIQWLRDLSPKSQLVRLKIEDLPKVTIDGEEEIQLTLLMTMLRGSLVYDSSSYALKALDVIKDLDVNKLETLLSTHIDLVSYRLDAWLTGLADYRLKELRANKPQGTYIGAYGFVHDLERSIDLKKVEHMPPGLSASNGRDVYTMEDNQGFIHGQSMNHAVTAAVLRAGYNSIKSRGDNNNALAVNLTSKRVRMALHLLEGVGNGQESSALLGYMFERALHEKYTDESGKPLEMDVYIYRLRRKFPTYADTNVNPTQTSQSESVRPTNVLDGLAMIDHFEKELQKSGLLDPDKTFVENIINISGSNIVFKGYPWGLVDQLPNPASKIGIEADLERKKLRAIIHELDNMADAFDALGDLVTSEGVYQLVRGNHVRASAVLNSISEGKVPLDPEIIRSMRQGAMVTHRGILQMPLITSIESPWPEVSSSPKSIAEPSINNWLASKIGNPDKIAWKATVNGSDTYLSLIDLGLQPIDLVLLVTSGGLESQSELEARCLNHLKSQGAQAGDSFKILFNESVSQGEFNFGEIVSMLQHLGKVIGAARASDARDYRIAENELNFGPTAAGIDTEEVLARIKNAKSSYEALLTSFSFITSDKTSYTEAEKSLMLDSLKDLSQWGFAGFYPSDDQENVLILAQRIISAKTKMEQDIEFAEVKLAELELEIDQGKWLSFLTEFCSKFFGSGFKIIPIVQITNSAEIIDQLEMIWAESPLRNHSENYISDWLSGISLVRGRFAELETVGFLDDILHGEKISLRPVQFPFETESIAADDRDHWLGGPYPSSYRPDEDRLSLLLFGHENIHSSITGLVIDEWMEIIPDEMETTGIAFHFNQPDARAPQNLLLAVPPEKTGKWDFETLGLCVEEAFNLARLRAVEPDQIDTSMFAQLLPATATLAFGNDEFAKRLAEETTKSGTAPKEDSNTDQLLGYYIDYTSVNRGKFPDKN